MHVDVMQNGRWVWHDEREVSAYSGTPEGGRAMLMTSLISAAFNTRSLGVVDVSDGYALTCTWLHG